MNRGIGQSNFRPAAVLVIIAAVDVVVVIIVSGRLVGPGLMVVA